MSDNRKDWLTSREAFDTSARLLHKMYPKLTTYKAQVQVLDENKQLSARVSKLEEALRAIIYDMGRLANEDWQNGQLQYLAETAENKARAALDGRDEKGKGV